MNKNCFLIFKLKINFIEIYKEPDKLAKASEMLTS